MNQSREIENFLEDSSTFIEEFKPVFKKYFVDLCISYDNFYSKETLLNVADIVYRDIFTVDEFLTSYEDDIFKDMREDGVMIGFLINRSMFFLLESYIKNAKDSVKCKSHVESLILCITEYINQFENSICDKNRLQPLHLNFDTTDNLSSAGNIIDVFREIKSRDDEVTFFNLYKGVPIEHKATIVDIDDGDVVFRTIQTQEIAMQVDGSAYILKDSNFNKCIKADILYNNFSNNTVVLNNFVYLLNMPAMDRKFIRVHPEIIVDVSLSSEKELLTQGKLFDLSVEGLGVISEENNGVYAGAKIDIVLFLDDSTHTKLEGEVLNIIEYSNSYRYCIKIFSKVETENKIKNYVKKREIEILDHLNRGLNSN